MNRKEQAVACAWRKQEEEREKPLEVDGDIENEFILVLALKGLQLSRDLVEKRDAGCW